MTRHQALQIFEENNIRVVWNTEEEKLYFSIIDICSALTGSDYITARKYWNKLKQRLVEEGNQTVTNCHQLKLRAADGKMRLTDVADQEQLFRIIQSIPSPKAEPVKVWIAQVASQRVDQMFDPELSMEQAVADYQRLGYPDEWIKARMRSIEVRHELTDEWKRSGIMEDRLYAALTNIITQGWSGKSVKEYKAYKGLTKQNLRDNMTNIELALNTLAEASTTELSKQQSPKGFQEAARTAEEGSDVARVARRELEQRLGRTVISPTNAHDIYLPQPEENGNNE